MSAPPIGTFARRSTTGQIVTRFVAAQIQTLGPRDFSGIAATDALCEQDDVALVMSGGDLGRIQGGPLSWDHKLPIGTIQRARTMARQLMIDASFAPQGTDEFIDKLCARVKNGVPVNLSLQFRIKTSEPITPGRPDRGIRALTWEALEVALVLVGADPGAVITARSARRRGNNAMSKAAAMTSAGSHAEAALDEHAALGRHHGDIADATQRLDEHRSRAGTALRAFKAACEAGDTDGAADAHQRCMRCLKGMNRELRAIGQSHSDASEAYGALVRSMRAAGGSLGISAETGADLAAQASDGAVDGSTGARSLSRERRLRELRQVDLHALGD
jgi:hypothetical protein